MNTFKRNVFLICGALVAIGIGLVISGFILGGKEGLSLDLKNKKILNNSGEVIEEEKVLGSFDEMDINIPSSSLEVIEGDSFKIEYRIRKDSKLDIDVKDGKLKLEYNPNGGFSINIFTYDAGDYFKLYIPKDKVIKKADIKLDSGSFKINGTDISDLKLKNDSGSVKINNMNSEKIDINDDSGSVAIENVTADNLKVDNESGSVTLNKVTAAKSEIKAESGSIKLSDFDTQDTEVKSDSGSIKMILTGSEEDYSFDIKAESGSMKIGEKSVGSDDDDEYVSGSGSRKIKVRAESGSIKIEFNN